MEATPCCQKLFSTFFGLARDFPRRKEQPRKVLKSFGGKLVFDPLLFVFLLALLLQQLLAAPKDLRAKLNNRAFAGEYLFPAVRPRRRPFPMPKKSNPQPGRPHPCHHAFMLPRLIGK